MPENLSAKQVRDFHLKGFLCVDSFLNPTEMKVMRTVYDEYILSKKVGPETSFADLQEQVPELRSLDFRERALRLVRQLIGEEAILRHEKYMYRPPEHAVETPWHQDWAFGHPNYLPFHVNFWVPLQDVDTTNGCLWYLPGSHVQDILPHRRRTDIEEGHQKDVVLEVEPEFVDEAKAVPALLPAGGVAIHHGCALHGARPNRSHEARRVYIMNFSGVCYERWVKKESDVWPWTAELRRAKEAAASA
jgi:ectoine hydroxylase-related dioxygenase (phytanoyl-CoA dioxygenase family)